MAEAKTAPPRDLRLDFFRGMALWFIYLDHIPSNALSWITVRNYGFSDATEIFVFISGLAGAMAYGRVLQTQGFGLAAARILHRCWQLYIAHIFLLVIFTAQVAYVTEASNNPLFADEMKITDFIGDPQTALLQALLLKFRPANLDVLPLYIVLLLSFPLILPCLLRAPAATFAASASVYWIGHLYDWNLPAYPEGGVWFFNPFGWQFLFVIGALLGVQPGLAARLSRRSKPVLALSLAYLLFAFLIVMTWQFPHWGRFVPPWLGELIYPISKTDEDPLRLFHFLALAYVTVYLVGPQARFLSWPVLRPLIACGRQSLHVFCVGTVLSFAGYSALVVFDGGLGAQVAVSLAGIAAMVAIAYLLIWYQRANIAAGGRRAATAGTAEPAP